MTSQTDFKTYFRQSAEKIERELHAFSKTWDKQIHTTVPQLRELNKRFTESLFGGKMLRGTLVRLGYDLVQPKPTDEIFKPAAAFEILHTGFLIHDDIIDQSKTRRGKPAIHVHKDEQYGISQAICLGDLGLTLATKLITESNYPIERKNKALSFFLRIVTDTILGEMLDIESPRNKTITESHVLTIHTLKTANYSIVGPMTVGAILGGADEKVLKNIKNFGEKLGIAYQLQDDILGIYGDEKKIGKSTTSDIEEKKSTLLLTYSLEHADENQKKELATYYGKKRLLQKEQVIIKKLIVETGALEYSQKEIARLIKQAKKFIPSLTQEEKKQTHLFQLCDLLLNRKE